MKCVREHTWAAGCQSVLYTWRGSCLSCYVMQTGRFGTRVAKLLACCTYFYICRYINVYSTSARRMLHLHCLSLQKEALDSIETCASVYPTTQRDIPEESNLQQHRCKEFRSRKYVLNCSVVATFITTEQNITLHNRSALLRTDS